MSNFIPEGAEVLEVIYPEEKVALKEFKDKHYKECIKNHLTHIEEDCAPTHPVYIEISEFSLGTSMRAVCEICKESLELCCDARLDIF